MTMNSFGATIIDNRFIGKIQLTADDLGGGCSTWAQYRQLCDNVVLASYARLHGKGVDSDTLGMSIAGLFTLFGVDAKATPAYQNRLMVSVIGRKAITSDELKQARKNMKEAKNNWESALEQEKSAEIVAELEAKYNDCKAIVDELYTQPNHYYFELTPMLDKSKKHASASARKAIEDTIADIIAERDLMTAEELQAEAQKLADERKGRELRKKQEAKAAKSHVETVAKVADEIKEKAIEIAKAESK